jgi:hypothetical protein
MAWPLSAYYHESVERFLCFVIPPRQRILLIQRADRDYRSRLDPAHAVLLDPTAPPGGEAQGDVRSGFSLEGIEGPFDYIVLCDILGFCDDIGSFLRGLTELCQRETRVIVLSHSYLWTPLLRIAEALKLKRPGGLANLLSKRDLVSYMTASGFQWVGYTPALLVPLSLLGLGSLLNWLARCLPFLDWAKLNQFNVFRRMPVVDAARRPSLSVVLTCRDEKENIEPLVQGIPRLCPDQEILFVEGHSVDGTREEIERVSAAHPDRNVRWIPQPGVGQGDAIREGFSRARGEIIILLEADQTSPPEEIRFVYHCLRLDHGEFVQGSRFVYPLSTDAMPRANQFGNAAFAAIMSRLFNQHMTDVLSGIKGIHRVHCQRLLARWGQLGVTDPFGDFELLFGAMRLGLKGVELPVHYGPRSYGKTKTRVLAHGAVLLRMALRAYFLFRR